MLSIFLAVGATCGILALFGVIIVGVVLFDDGARDVGGNRRP